MPVPVYSEKQMMHELGMTRSKVQGGHALITPDTFVRQQLPGWSKTQCIVHTGPVLGARFNQYSAEMEKGGKAEPAREDTQRFVLVLEGRISVKVARTKQEIGKRGYVYLPAGSEAGLEALTSSRLAVIEKPYQPLPGVRPPRALWGYEPKVPPTLLGGDPSLQVRMLLPDDLSFDLAVNTMTFAPGASLPMVEIHLMEHGLLMLDGGGIYRLGEDWYPVKAGDFIWMASYCPQWFGALGKEPSKYLLYKDMNRHPLT